MSCATTLISRIVDDVVDLVGEHALRQIAVARFFEIVDDGLFEPQRAAGVAGRAIAMIDQQLGDALPDRAEADDGDFSFFHRRDFRHSYELLVARDYSQRLMQLAARGE